MASSRMLDEAYQTQPAVALSTLRPGDRAWIVSLAGAGAFAGRLRDLGFVPGSSVTVRRQAPFRDPVEYEVRNTRICLRRSEADQIIVLVEDPVPSA